jgi:hypothetical protein
MVRRPAISEPVLRPNAGFTEPREQLTAFQRLVNGPVPSTTTNTVEDVRKP